MTIVEAKNKICPHIKSLNTICTSSNLTANINCIGDACMAWDWHNIQTKEIKIGHRLPSCYIYKKSNTKGYCRLISKQLVVEE